MNTILEEIRKRIKAASDDTEAGPYDEYESGQRVGLATALQIIDEVEKEHPIPEDVWEAAEQHAAEQTPVEYPNLYDEEAIKTAYASGMLGERRRLMKDAVEIEIGWSDGYRIAPANENSMNEALAKIGVLDQVGAGVDAEVSVIIIKKEK